MWPFGFARSLHRQPWSRMDAAPAGRAGREAERWLSGMRQKGQMPARNRFNSSTHDAACKQSFHQLLLPDFVQAAVCIHSCRDGWPAVSPPVARLHLYGCTIASIIGCLLRSFELKMTITWTWCFILMLASHVSAPVVSHSVLPVQPPLWTP